MWARLTLRITFAAAACYCSGVFSPPLFRYPFAEKCRTPLRGGRPLLALPT